MGSEYRLFWHDDVIKWKNFPRYLPFVRGIHRSPVNSPHKGQWRRALMFSLICVWINGWVNNHEAGYLRRYRAHYEVIVMKNPCLERLIFKSDISTEQLLWVDATVCLTAYQANRKKTPKPHWKSFVRESIIQIAKVLGSISIRQRSDISRIDI